MDIFSKIAAGEIPSYKCAESEKFYAFLDINPVAKGHTLVIPRREVDYIFDMDDEEIAEYQVFAKKVAMALTGLPSRPNKTTRLSLEMEYISAKDCQVTVRDLGFGDLYPSSGKVWKETVQW